ncbi:Nucleoside-diphosphate-sugar epimerase [Prauserella marina]|uniref:Nucleoside-diphosphate-sugar epimerase n=1 Tax=Prauserella marina TaxID=530584 RepID=A0A1G6UM05_9PSEU|nr:NAD(P)-dependent oxidoreductase [Prauserella marina]PWV74754.1 nucleoside-diphosphate-sugar epimerase [Prauserella marina]SDD41565.1 Nucleoside-diphosphate-sugar epimerase [Prauserella marina]
MKHVFHVIAQRVDPASTQARVELAHGMRTIAFPALATNHVSSHNETHVPSTAGSNDDQEVCYLMRILITGATGRVGANLVHRLAGSGAHVRAMVQPGDPNSSKLAEFRDVEITEADLLDQDAINAACRDVTHVVHLAAQLVRGTTPVDRFYDINAFGTLRLLEGVLNHGASIQRFVLASSDGTYCPGAPPSVPLTEESKQEPADYYGTGKLLGEVILRNHGVQFDLPWSIVRFATVVSPEEAPRMFRLGFWKAIFEWEKLGKDTHLWPLFKRHQGLLDLLAEQTRGLDDEVAVALVGPGDEPWSLSMVDVRDAVEGVYLSLTSPSAVGKAFNIAAAQPTSHIEGAREISDFFRVENKIVPMPFAHRIEMSITAAQTDLQFAPRHDFRSMLRSSTGKTVSQRDVFVPAEARSGVASTWT